MSGRLWYGRAESHSKHRGSKETGEQGMYVDKISVNSRSAKENN